MNICTLPGVLSGMHVGAFEIGIPFIFFGLAMRKTHNPALINQMYYLSPFVSLFLIAVVLGEKIVFTTYVGLMPIVFGVVFNGSSRKPCGYRFHSLLNANELNAFIGTRTTRNRRTNTDFL